MEKVLEKLAKDKFILGYLRNRTNDWLDKEGVDFLIIKKGGMALPLQVKTESRNFSQEEKKREHLRKHPLILFLICVPIHLLNNESEKVYRQVESEIKEMLK